MGNDPQEGTDSECILQLLLGPSKMEPQLSTGVTCLVMPLIGFPASPVPLIPVHIFYFGAGGGGWGRGRAASRRGQSLRKIPRVHGQCGSCSRRVCKPQAEPRGLELGPAGKARSCREPAPRLSAPLISPGSRGFMALSNSWDSWW